MIRIRRCRRDSNGDLIQPSAGWFARASRATASAVRYRWRPDFQFDRSVYSDSEVRGALAALFYGKCCYCEWKIVRADIDIDHYRPKASINRVRNHPGYYWLAYEWRNLLPSCTFCNRLRGELEEWPSSEKLPTGGKGDSFPLNDEGFRARCPNDDLLLEDPLLLDPTVDDPEEHLTFDPAGRPIAIRDSIRGRVSIAVLNLDTKRINDDRMKVIENTLFLLKMRRRAHVGNERYDNAEVLEEIDARIKCSTEDAAPYAAVARAVVRDPYRFG